MQSGKTRRPGELAFNIAILAASLFLFYSAYGISGFEALSSPGAVPMATTFVMVIAAAMIVRQTVARPASTGETLSGNIIPMSIIVTIIAVAGYALLLQPLGFLPTSFLFLFVMTWYLSRRNPLFCLLVSAGIVAGVYLVFRLIFSVLMPPGIVPEGEVLAWFRHLVGGGN